jgi:flagellar hook-basal body complex protein FliE
MISTPVMQPSIGTETVRTLQTTLRQAQGANSDFSNFLESAIQAVDQRQIAADAQLLNTATGENVDLHGQMIALEEANISLRTMASVRDKVVDAYHAIWNMPV